jgi:Carboxypeptidase regulatory-like domain/TonB dependent receptor
MSFVRSTLSSFSFLLLVIILLFQIAPLHAQQTLGGVVGTVTDPSGAAVSGTLVVLTGDTTGLTLKATSKKDGSYAFINIPIGSYTLTFSHEGFEISKVPSIPVQENRTGAINIVLKVGSINTTVEVVEQPLLNTVDTTNGYVLDSQQIQETPLPTGSFTRLAVLTPGVSSELQHGIGTNAGLGNAPIWANGQRDTSNMFQVNGVDVTNLFNGKSSSQSASQRYSFNIGQGASVAGESQTNISVAGSNGQGLATPPPEFIQEIRVNTSSYDAQQGNSSGAQVDVNTITGTNKWHGQIYGTRATNWLNAAPFFNKQPSNNIPANQINPDLHRYLAGGTVGGPIIRNKLFFFGAYQYTRDTDAYKGLSKIQVPVGLTDDRSTTGIVNAVNSWNNATKMFGGTQVVFNGTVDPVAAAILQAKLPNGQFLIPSAQNTNPAAIITGAPNVTLQSTPLARGDQASAALDYNIGSRDRLSLKYYYQHTPTTSAFANANTIGFPEGEDAGAQVAAISNAITIGSRFNWEQRFGFSRQKVYSNFGSQLGGNTFGINFPGGTGLPGLSLAKFAYSNGGSVTAGPNSAFVNAGYFQNRWNPSTNAIYSLGKHTFTAGGNYNYTQLNIRNLRSGLGRLSTANFVTFVEGQVTSSNILTGNSNRYYRANEGGAYLQDKWQILSTLSLTLGVRYDYNGGFTEKNGNIFNFDPKRFNVTDSQAIDSGFVVASNNKFSPTAGATASTLTGRQWGIGPRVGFAFAPKRNAGKVVFRGGFGMYFDRGELFSRLSQPAGSTTGGPFGVTEAPPLANYVTGTGTRTLENPLGSAVVPVPSPDPAFFTRQLPTLNAMKAGCTGVINQSNGGCTSTAPFNFGAYDMSNKLPYTFNFKFDIQWQPRNDLAVTIGYTGNLGRHAVIPVPFNEPGIATPGSPIHGENSSYGWEVLNANSPNGKFFNPISTEPYNTFDGGNIDFRVPFVGYSPNSTLFKAAGVSSYNALETHVVKTLSHYTQFGVSYTYSHSLDEQSDVGLFFTGDNPDNLRDSYASADFDRTNIFQLQYLAQLPKFAKDSTLLGKFTNGWQLVGLATLQSGEPFSLYEFDGAVGSLYFGNFPTLANPVLGIKNGSNPRSALTGHIGAFQNKNANGSYSSIPAIDPSQLQMANLQPGQKGIPTCVGNEPCDIFENDFTPGQRNIFRQSFQKDADISIQKITTFHDRYSVRYSLDIFNVTNTPSFDVPNNSASISQGELRSTTVNGKPATTSTAFGQVLSAPTSQQTDFNSLYVQPTLGSSTFGAVRNTIGGSRTVEMSLHIVY